jgi:hypothetical protein
LGEVSASQEEHPEVAEVFGQSEYVFEWLPTTVENCPHSDEELKAMTRRIEERLARLK